jgi:hypothetical protein
MSFVETVQSIDFRAVGATGLLPLDISEAVIKEKLSLMLYARYISETGAAYDSLCHSEIKHPSDRKNNTYQFTVKVSGTEYSAALLTNPVRLFYSKVITKLGGKLASCTYIPIKANAGPEEISIYDYMRKESDSSDSDRIKELLKYFGLKNHPYSKFTLPTTFRLQHFPNTLPTKRNGNMEVFENYQRELKQWYYSGFPRRYELDDPDKKTNQNGNTDSKYAVGTDRFHIPLPSPVFYQPLGPMAYSMADDYPEMRLHRLFLNPEACGLREALIPSIVIQKGKYMNAVMTGFPAMDQFPLWEVEQILHPNTETVVLCACIQDAEALQRDNKDIDHVAFTSFIDVGKQLELVDFTPLNKKKIIFLVSNHNGGTLADAYEEVAQTYEFIKKAKIKIKDCLFVQREVQYPDSTLTIATPGDLARAYCRTSPTIVPKSLLYLDETAFFSFLAKIRKEREALPFWVSEEQKPVKKNPAEGILIRSLLYRNAITVLAGPPAVGKSRFCCSLIRYLVKGNERKYMKERFWTRCCKKSIMKILYWNFDCVHNFESWKESCLRGLKDEQKQNIFIEEAPTEEEFFDKIYGRPDLGVYKRKLEKYAYKGTPGHPLDLLIVDTLVSVWNKKNIEASLQFLSKLMKAVPGMAVLAIHHTSELGKPLGGGDSKRMPRIVMTMERINRKVTLDSSSKQSTKKEKGEKKTFTHFYKFRYDKFSTSHADIENLPFYCVREDEDMYSVYKPVCTRDEMFGSLVFHYRENDDAHPSNKVIGAMLGYSNREIQKRAINEKTYLAILNNAEKKAKKEV